MPKITLEVSEELQQQLELLGDNPADWLSQRLPDFLTLSLQQPTLPAHVYRHVLNFLASNPTPDEIAEFRPTSEMQERLRTLLSRSKTGALTPTEQLELDEYERIEHLVILLKAKNRSQSHLES